ncbi:hypothetical protein [Niallia taxi]|uniref:hypothetical protein n=1 Tax=Niallia taxi TaxID=2499688 RepID=UPI0015F37E92|nr:hypothetical protein [Niallia taxi]
MNKTMKKKVIAGLVGVGIAFSGTQVFATTALDTNMVSLVKGLFANDTVSASSDVNVELEEQQQLLKGEAKEVIKESVSQSKTRINEYKEQEIQNGKAEMQEFVDQLETEVNTAVQNEEKNAKAAINTKKAEKVQEFKDELLSELQAELEAELKGNGNSNGNNGNGNAYGHNK